MRSDTDQFATITCDACGKVLRLPANRGKLKVTCPACRHDFEWVAPTPEDQDIYQSFGNIFADTNSSAAAAPTAEHPAASSQPLPIAETPPQQPPTPVPPQSQSERAPANAGPSGLAVTTTWLVIGLLAVWTLFALERLAGLHVFVLSMALILFGIYTWMRAKTKVSGGIAALITGMSMLVVVATAGFGVDLYKNSDLDFAALLTGSPSSSTDADDPFQGRTARNTNLQQLDALMEDW